VDLNRCARDPRERILVQPGDFLILQESPGESFTRYFNQTVKFNVFTRLLNKTDATITQTYTGRKAGSPKHEKPHSEPDGLSGSECGFRASDLSPQPREPPPVPRLGGGTLTGSPWRIMPP